MRTLLNIPLQLDALYLKLRLYFNFWALIRVAVVGYTMPGSADIEIEVGDNGAGEHCEEQLMRYGGGAALVGSCYGAVESCFLKPVPGQTTPLIFQSFKLSATRSVLFGVIGATFAVGACLSARFREKDDYKNAVVGGMLAGLIFGYKTRSWAVGLRMAAGMGTVLGVIKYRNGTYLPQLIPQEESFEVRRSKWINS